VKLPNYQPDAATSTRFLFFTGKGGVGKTSLSCATALKLVEAGKRVLLVSTDPASNLDEVLETTLTNAPTPIAGAPGLDALNINPVSAAAAYRERLIGPMRGLLPEAALRSMEEQLSGSCTVEIAAFDEFSGLIGDPEAAKAYDHVIFDTAPTGHTLRLMSLAKAWDQFLDKNTSGTSCLGPLAGLEKQRGIYEATVNTLADAKATTLVLVSRPQLSALREAERTSKELRALGVANQCLVINGVLKRTARRMSPHRPCSSAVRSAMQAAHAFIASMPSFIVPLRSINILGIGGLRALLNGRQSRSRHSSLRLDGLEPAGDAKPRLSRGRHRAAGPRRHHDHGQRRRRQNDGRRRYRRAARETRSQRPSQHHRSRRAHRANARWAVGRPHAQQDRSRCRNRRLHSRGPGKSRRSNGRRRPLLARRRPALALHRGNRRVPRLCPRSRPGHETLRRARHRAHRPHAAPSRCQRGLSSRTRTPGPQHAARGGAQTPRTPARSRLHAHPARHLPEATPVHEAAALQDDLRRAHIEPCAWVINQSLLQSGSCDPLLQRREHAEHRYIQEVVEKQATRTAWLPWQAEEPVGPDALAHLASTARCRAHGLSGSS
jgi:arsenite-transporting ATPase